ncbi:MAG: sulfatase [Persicimonas sp.]
MSLPLLVGVWFLSAHLAGGRILEAVNTTAFAVLLLAGVQLLAALALWLASALVIVPLEVALSKLADRLPNPLALPALVAGGLALAGLATLVGGWFVLPDVWPYLPWIFVASPAVGLLGGVGALRLCGDRKREKYGLVLGGTVVLVLGVATVYLPQSLSEARGVFVDRTSVASAWYGVLQPQLDYDDDDAIHLYGDNDCAPRNPDIGPHQREVVGNGIDENCSGADLDVDMSDFDTGQRRHDRPDGVVDKPNIVLVTTDALSQHRTTVGGYERNTTPNLAEFADSATVFENAFAVSSSTRLALPGLLTGKFNSMVEMEDGGGHPYAYDEDEVTLGTVLADAGYHSVHIPGHKYFMEPRWGGQAIGFDRIITSAYRDAEKKRHTAPEVTKEALDQIERHKGRDKPLFLWVHYYDHHGPYKTPQSDPPFPTDTESDRYDNEVHYADEHWAQLFDAAERTWEDDEHLVIFTSDHGESFDDRHPKGRRHDFTLDTKVLRVPLIIRGPEQRGQRYEGLASHTDVLPTVANLVDAPVADDWVGESLVPPLFEGEPVEKEILFSLFYIPEAVKRDADGFEMIGVRTAEYSYWEKLEKGKRFLIDWKNDPAERHNLAEERPEEFEKFRYLAAEKLEWLREREKGLTAHQKKKK